MTFTGWQAEALEFFDRLEEENTKAFWERNKGTYETLVRGPMEELLSELQEDWGKGRIFRPYRDVRFSKDKSPYKTNIAATIGDGYVSLGAGGLGAGVGMWEMAPDQLERYRRAVDQSRTGARLARIVDDIRREGVELTGHGVLKTAPKGYAKDHPRIELLQWKGIVAWREWPAGAWLGTKRAKERVAEVFRVAKPLNAWLRANVGPTTSPDRMRG
jgi:uncharacterized protein (TIGR02453 family)